MRVRPPPAIRQAVDSDRPAVIRIARQLVAAADTYAFDFVGAIPGGFRMPDGALVDHHIMHRNL